MVELLTQSLKNYLINRNSFCVCRNHFVYFGPRKAVLINYPSTYSVDKIMNQHSIHLYENIKKILLL